MGLRDETKINPLTVTSPRCPKCKGDMVERLAKQGKRAGRKFWGCMDYHVTGCNGSMPLAMGNAMIQEARDKALRDKSNKAEAEARKGDPDFAFLNFMDLD
jgi:ssDNA-binding Zn-finger/Zn-ribbon topoisomerase 1